MFQWGSAINRLGGTDTWPLLVVDWLQWLVLSVGTRCLLWPWVTIFRVQYLHQMLSIPSHLSHWSWYNIMCDLGDCDCLTITPLSLLPDIHIFCCPGSNGSRVAICSMSFIENFLSVGFSHCLFLTDNTSFWYGRLQLIF